MSKMPQADWTVEELAKFARKSLDALSVARRQRVCEVWRAGGALKIARDKLTDKKKWVAWQKRNGFGRTTVSQAILIWEHFKDDGELRHLNITQAKQKAGIPIKERAAAPAAVSATAKLGEFLPRLEQILAAAKEESADGPGTELALHVAELGRMYEDARQWFAGAKPARRRKAAV